MAHAKLVSSFKFDTEFPRDRLVCTLNFNNTGPEINWSELCADLAEVWDTQWFTLSSPEIIVKAYDNQGTPPVLPMGEHVRGAGGGLVISDSPREVALCLSYYADTNQPRRRGRVYLPCNQITNLGLRPSTAIMNQALGLANSFAGLGGLDIDWEVWSPTSNAGMTVTNAWVDDEWDTQRRRGLRPTTRVTSTPGG